MTKRISTLAFCLFALAGCDAEPRALGVGELPADPFTGSSDDIADPTACEVHCAEYRATCGSDSHYASMDECETLCGYAETEDGNLSVKCRDDVLLDYEASNAEDICRDAGPDSETCGTAFIITCERYCDEYQETCSHAGDGFESRTKCMTWCEDMPLAAETPGDDSIECRLDRLGASLFGPTCDDAGPKTDVCG